MNSPFLLIPWQADFLKALLERALEDTGGEPGRATFIFPHARPIRYMKLLLRNTRALKRPLIMPRMHTISELFSALAASATARPAWNAGLLDRVGLLMACVRDDVEAQAMHFTPEPRLFFPWGLRLAALFEECFSQCRTPGNFLHAGGEVSPYAAMLLARLGHIFARYREALKAREWSTPGHDAFLSAAHIERHKELPGKVLPEQGPVYIAGFHLLTGAEDALFRLLWEKRGARVLLHADPQLVENPGKAHWSCGAFGDWAKAWRAQLELVDIAGHGGPATAPPRLRCFAGYDLHSQLTVLQDELAGLGFEGDECLEEMHNEVSQEELLPPAARGAAAPLDPAILGCVAARAGKRTGETHNENALTQKLPAPYPDIAGSRGAATPLAAGGNPTLHQLPHEFPPPPAEDRQAHTAVLLPSGGLLMPVLHHLPRTDINISMGYPLARSPLFRLLDTLARLQERRKGAEYYWRDLVDFIRHPYVKMLQAGEGEDQDRPGGEVSLRRALHLLERTLRALGRAWVEPGDLLERTRLDLEREAGREQRLPAMLHLLLDTALSGFEHPRCTRDLAEALEKLCALLIARGGRLWERFPIDAECLYRLRQSLIPELARCEISREELPADSLFAILRGLIEAERVPFEAEPLVGLQVMGMLESRLLSFSRVIIVDANEEWLPGSPAGDPLLPEALRPELGLPSPHKREQASAYVFFRLLAGAREVTLLWREGGAGAGIQEQRTEKSRFVAELLWEEEKRLGRLLRAHSEGQQTDGQQADGPLTVLGASVGPIRLARRELAVTAPLRALLDDMRKKPVSASLLNGYLRCPAQFCYERLLRLAPAEEMKEGDDPLAVGDLFHHALYAAYQRRLQSPLPGGEELDKAMREELLESFFNTSDFDTLARTLPADSLAMLVEAGTARLSEYLRRQPPSTVLALETPLGAAFERGGLACRLTGIADRIDCRNDEESGDEGLVILDYKTGFIPRIAASLWEDDSLWQGLEDWRPDEGPEADRPLHELARRLQNVQLPLYLLLYDLCARQKSLPAELACAGSLPLRNALWVALGNRGEEVPLFARKTPAEAVQHIVAERIPVLMHFLLRHLFESPVFRPRPGAHCDWCFHTKSCIQIAGPKQPL